MLGQKEILDPLARAATTPEQKGHAKQWGDRRRGPRWRAAARGQVPRALVPRGTWCSGVTSASHAEGPVLTYECVHFPNGSIILRVGNMPFSLVLEGLVSAEGPHGFGLKAPQASCPHGARATSRPLLGNSAEYIAKAIFPVGLEPTTYGS